MRSNGHRTTGNGNANAASLLTDPVDRSLPQDVQRTGERPSDDVVQLQRLLDEAVADAQAVSALVAALGKANSLEGVVSAAIDAVRSAFGWNYGSFWKLEAQ